MLMIHGECIERIMSMSAARNRTLRPLRRDGNLHPMRIYMRSVMSLAHKRSGIPPDGQGTRPAVATGW